MASRADQRLVLGTRGSALALWQARHVAAAVESLHPGLQVELRTVKTAGDVHGEVPFGKLAGKGFFVKEIEAALLSGSIDLAVHSLKDMPTDLPRGLTLAAVLERHDARDALVSEDGRSFDQLAAGTVLGTGSLRRRCQLLHARPELRIEPVRGNVGTRIRKLREGRFGALVMALAGVERLAVRDVSVRAIPVSLCLPAAGQGAITVETRTDDPRVRRRVEPLTHEPTRTAVRGERAFLARLGGGCLAPATAFARVEGERIRLDAVVGDPDGRRLMRERAEGPLERAERLGEELATRMLDAGAGEILRQAREGADEPGDP